MNTSIWKPGRTPLLVASLSSLFAVALTATLLLAACASAPDIRHQRDPSADLRELRRFAFFDPAAGAARYTTPLQTRLRAAARTELERKGYVYDEAAAELRVNLDLRVRERQELRSAPSTMGFRAPRGWSDLETVAYREGTLIVDLVDARRRVAVWRAIAEGRLDADAQKDPDRVVDTVMQQVFAPLPVAGQAAPASPLATASRLAAALVPTPAENAR